MCGSVDDLDDVKKLEEYVRASDVVLIIVTDKCTALRLQIHALAELFLLGS